MLSQQYIKAFINFASTKPFGRILYGFVRGQESHHSLHKPNKDKQIILPTVKAEGSCIKWRCYVATGRLVIIAENMNSAPLKKVSDSDSGDNGRSSVCHSGVCSGAVILNTRITPLVNGLKAINETYGEVKVKT